MKIAQVEIKLGFSTFKLIMPDSNSLCTIELTMCYCLSQFINEITNSIESVLPEKHTVTQLMKDLPRRMGYENLLKYTQEPSNSQLNPIQTPTSYLLSYIFMTYYFPIYAF